MKNTRLWTALITPMHLDGRIHFEDLEKIARLQDSAGNGILLLGSTGEGLALNIEEKKSIVDFATGMNLNVPLMVGVGGFNHEAQKEWIQYCNRQAVDAFLLVTPLYARPGVVGQTQWFGGLMDEAKKPCMIYNIPSRTGVKLSPKVLKALENHKQFWAVKEASGSIDEYKEFRSVSPNIPLFSGDDGLLASFADAGCHGLVSVASNAWPEATKRYTEKCLKGDTEDLFPLWKNAISALFSAPNPIPVKCLLREKGVIETAALRSPLTEEDMGSTDQVIEMDRKILNWYKTN